MVITDMTRNHDAPRGTWVRIPPAPPSDANLNSAKVYFLSGLLVAVANWQNKKA